MAKRRFLQTWYGKTLAGLLAVFVAVQFVPVSRSNPPVETDIGAPPEIETILRRSCYDCHSNETRWPWYAYVAPVSWLTAHDVEEGRDHLNFSTWNRYSEEDREHHIYDVWEEVVEEEMPLWFYVPLHPEAALSDEEIELIRAWAGGPVGVGKRAIREDGHDHGH